MKIKTELLQYILVTGCFLQLWGEIIALLSILIILVTRNTVIKINKTHVLLFIGIFFISIISIYFNGYSFNNFIEQFFLVATFSITYHIILSRDNWDTSDIFKKYLIISFYVCILGIIQWVIFKISGIDIFRSKLYAGTFRISSIMGEPGGLAQITLPAVIYYLRESIKSKKFVSFQGLVILIVFIMTRSTAAYLILTIFIIHQFWIYKKIFTISISIIIILFTIYFSGIISFSNMNSDNGQQNKIVETFQGLFELEPSSFELLNASSYSTLSNLYVSIHSKSRLFGTGLGTHGESYRRIYKSNYYLYGLNSEDAYSLSIRIFSELGLLGIILLLLFLYKNYNSSDNISIAIFYLFLFVMIRGGHYTLFGLILFGTIYYLRKNHFNNLNKLNSN